MSTSIQVFACHVQRDVLAIQEWWKEERARRSKNYLRFYNRVKTILQKNKPWWAFIFGWEMDPEKFAWGDKLRLRWYRSKHVKAMFWINDEDVITTNRLLAAAQRILGENATLSNPSMTLSSEDALFLKTYIQKVKGKK